MPNHPLIKTLDEIHQKRINNSIHKILENKEFMDLLSNKAICELPIGTIDESSINIEITSISRIDLAIFATNKITIIDYKSDQIVPTTIDNVPNEYLKQLAKYHRSMTKIYPEKEIITKILWLENGHLMNIN
jgi:ATP-dependent helicase/nuclease subunit A